LTRFFFPASIRIHLIPQPNHSALTPPKASFQQRFGSEVSIAVARAVLGAIMMASNPWLTPVDDEIAIIDVAAKPAFATIKLFVSGGGQHEHPPLSDLILQGRLWLTNGNIHLIRLPSVIFYLLGAWFLVQAARRMGGDRARNYTLILLLLWPYGFHLGRLTGWYSFTFLLVSLLTFAYLKYLERPSPGTWMPVVLCALALVYTNYFGWAVLGLLGLELLLRFGRERRTWLLLLATGMFLIVASLPIMRPLMTELRTGAVNGRASSPLATGIYNLYCLFVSESVAPWIWVAGIAAGLAIAVVLLLVFVYAKPEARRFFLYFAALMTVMTFLPIVTTRRTLMISPWLILPVGTTLGTMTLPSARRLLAGSLVLVGAIGWYGIFSRKLYAAPQWVEPWDQVARQAAEVASNGGIVIGNNPSFFFYLTYFMAATSPAANGNFAGILPSSARAPNIYSPQEWMEAGTPTKPVVVVFDGLSFGVPGPSMGEIRVALSARCKTVGEQDLVRDAGAKWKQEYQPTTGQRVWRIRVVTFEWAAQ
jgi:Dolichyl-phosphate-mannose-protein mannosyltransferase